MAEVKCYRHVRNIQSTWYGYDMDTWYGYGHVREILSWATYMDGHVLDITGYVSDMLGKV